MTVNLTRVDLAHDPAARRARRRPLLVQVRFAAQPGRLSTREGEVAYASGDALVTGAAGDHWPVPRARFIATYAAELPTQAGEDGAYRRRPEEVRARRMDAPFTVTLDGARGSLHGDAGDWLVQYAGGDLAVVDAPIFDATYDLRD